MKWKDSIDGVEKEADDEGTFEEDYSPLKTRQLDVGSRLALIFSRPGVWLVAVPVVLIALLILSIRTNGEDKTLLLAMDQRLQQIENRMGSLDGGNIVTEIEKNRQAVQSLLARLDRLETSIAKRFGEMDQQLTQPQTKRTDAAASPNQKPVAESRPSKQTAKTHVVKKGETLYSISRQYGLSVTQLMQFNQLSKGAVINPGQSLKIQP